MGTKTTSNTKVINFRAPSWLLKELDKKRRDIVFATSTEFELAQFTRTDLIVDSIVQYNNFKQPDVSDNPA